MLVVDFNDMLIYFSDYLISSGDFPHYVPVDTFGLVYCCCCCFLINPLKAGKNSHFVKIQRSLLCVSDSPKYYHSVNN